jgi:hypothetical protein
VTADEADITEQEQVDALIYLRPVDLLILLTLQSAFCAPQNPSA